MVVVWRLRRAALISRATAGSLARACPPPRRLQASDGESCVHLCARVCVRVCARARACARVCVCGHKRLWRRASDHDITTEARITIYF